MLQSLLLIFLIMHLDNFFFETFPTLSFSTPHTRPPHPPNCNATSNSLHVVAISIFTGLPWLRRQLNCPFMSCMPHSLISPLQLWICMLRKNKYITHTYTVYHQQRFKKLHFFISCLSPAGYS